jgi:hypothetical protein
MPPYKPVPYKGFGGGLNLRDSEDVVGEDQAIDALNVLFSSRGSVQQRSGYAKLTAAEGTNRYDSLSPFYKTDGTKQIVAGAGKRLEALSAGGVVLANITTPTAFPHFFRRFGGPTGEHIYISNGADTVRRWDGAAFSTPVYTGVTPTGKFLGLSLTDNRLVNARFVGVAAGANPSTVRFSMEGDPLTFNTTHYVDLQPGDGEEIMGVATWRDMTVVFKQTKFFVFYGNSVDDEGDPVFNFRTVDAGVGLVAPQAVAISEQGIYFLDRTGVYFTSGAQPSRVSDSVEHIFHGAPSVFYQGGQLNDASIASATMTYHDERLFFSFPAGASATNNSQLVFDPHEKWWGLFDLPAGPMINFRPGSVEELVFGYATGLKHMGRYVEGTYLADDMSTAGTGGVAITSRWRSGWFDLGTQAVKSLREFKLAGSGQVKFGMSRDYKQIPAFSVTKVLSPAAAIYDSGVKYDAGAQYGPTSAPTTKMVRRAIRGERFSVMFSNAELNKSFKINRLTSHVRDVRVPSVVKA